MIGTGIDGFLLIAGEGAAATQVKAKEYFLGYLSAGDSLQTLLDRFDLVLPTGELPVLSVAVTDTVNGGYIVKKYLVPLSSGVTYSPLGNYADEKTLILVYEAYPDNQSTDAALSAVDAYVFPEFTIGSLSGLLNYLNTSATPFDVTDESKIFYFKFTAGTDNYVYVLSPDAVRGVYGQGQLQFTSADIVQFFSSAITDYSLLDKKLNKGDNTELENLADTTDVYGIALLDRKGAPTRKASMYWNEAEKKFTIEGTQAIWSATPAVTDGNMGIKSLSGALESFKIFDNIGNFLSSGIDSGKRLLRVFTAFRLVNGTAYNEREFKTVEIATTDATAVIKSFTMTANSVLTVDVMNINLFTSDKKYITGAGTFTFLHDGTNVTMVGDATLRYGRQYSTLKGSAGFVTVSDSRVDAAISGTTVTIQYVNADAKLTTLHCEVLHNRTLLPTE